MSNKVDIDNDGMIGSRCSDGTEITKDNIALVLELQDLQLSLATSIPEPPQELDREAIMREVEEGLAKERKMLNKWNRENRILRM